MEEKEEGFRLSVGELESSIGKDRNLATLLETQKQTNAGGDAKFSEFQTMGTDFVAASTISILKKRPSVASSLCMKSAGKALEASLEKEDQGDNSWNPTNRAMLQSCYEKRHQSCSGSHDPKPPQILPYDSGLSINSLNPSSVPSFPSRSSSRSLSKPPLNSLSQDSLKGELTTDVSICEKKFVPLSMREENCPSRIFRRRLNERLAREQARSEVRKQTEDCQRRPFTLLNNISSMY